MTHGYDNDDYAPLYVTLCDAYRQAANGKGKWRHARDGKPFMEQPIITITRRFGIGFPLGQVEKKIDEAANMARNGRDVAAIINELYGAIVYCAAAVLAIQEKYQVSVPADDDDLDIKVGGTD